MQLVRALPACGTVCRPLKVFIPQLQIERFGD